MIFHLLEIPGNAYTKKVSISDFYLNLNDYFYQPYATLGKVSNPEKNANNNKSSDLDSQSKSLTTSSSEPAVKTIGLAVFKEDKLVGTLSSVETLCHILILNDLDYCTINIPNPLDSNKTLDLYLSNFKNNKITVDIVNGSPFVTSTFDVSARILSFNENTSSQENLTILENATIQYLTEQLYNYCDKTSKEFNSDISGIGRFAAKNFRTLDEWKKYNWLENYKNATFKVKVKTSIKSGLIN